MSVWLFLKVVVIFTFVATLNLITNVIRFRLATNDAYRVGWWVRAFLGGMTRFETFLTLINQNSPAEFALLSANEEFEFQGCNLLKQFRSDAKNNVHDLTFFVVEYEKAFNVVRIEIVLFG